MGRSRKKHFKYRHDHAMFHFTATYWCFRYFLLVLREICRKVSSEQYLTVLGEGGPMYIFIYTCIYMHICIYISITKYVPLSFPSIMACIITAAAFKEACCQSALESPARIIHLWVRGQLLIYKHRGTGEETSSAIRKIWSSSTL